ncbi:MAG: SMC-Scp complex subunit ScpB [Patescibacteria group bacterium]
MARAGIEALIFAAQEPVTTATMAGALGLDEHTVRQLVQDLMEEYRAGRRGIQIVEAAGGYVFLTHPECAPFVEKLQRLPRTAPLSQAALETLAIVAYRQPITRAEIEEVRGVRVESALNTLIDRDLIRETGRRDAPGRPILYGTTREFLKYFGLRTLADLPPPDEWAGDLSAKGDATEHETDPPPEA